MTRSTSRASALAAAVAVFAGVGSVAHAAGMDLTAAQVAAGSSRVTSCDPSANGWKYSFENDIPTGTLVAVTVSGIAGTCRNGTLTLTLSQSGTVRGSLPPSLLTAEDCPTTCSKRLTIAGSPGLDAVNTAHASIVGAG